MLAGRIGVTPIKRSSLVDRSPVSALKNKSAAPHSGQRVDQRTHARDDASSGGGGGGLASLGPTSNCPSILLLIPQAFHLVLLRPTAGALSPSHST